MNSRPLFKHDCSCCTFLGLAWIDGVRRVDYFQCGNTYIAREGDKPEDNRALPINIFQMFAHADPVWRKLLLDVFYKEDK